MCLMLGGGAQIVKLFITPILKETVSYNIKCILALPQDFIDQL